MNKYPMQYYTSKFLKKWTLAEPIQLNNIIDLIKLLNWISIKTRHLDVPLSNSILQVADEIREHNDLDDDWNWVAEQFFLKKR